MPEESMKTLRVSALQLVMKTLGEGQPVPDHREKLAILGVSI
jgi:hypothetical protein